LKIIKKINVFMLTIMTFATIFFQAQVVLAAEGGVSLGTTGMFGRDLIDASGISGTTNYSPDGMSFNFKYTIDYSSSRRRDIVYQFEVEPDLAPYVTYIAVDATMGRKAKINVEATTPGEFYFMIKNRTFRGYDIVDVNVYLNCPYRALPKNKYAYSIGMLDPNLDFQYILKTRATGLVEKNPTVYQTNDFRLRNLQSFVGYAEGRPVEGDKLVDPEVNLYQNCNTYIRRNDMVMKVDPSLVPYIDRVDVYNVTTGKCVTSSNVTGTGFIKIPVSTIYPRRNSSNHLPMNFKIYLKNGMTFGDIAPGAYELTTYAELATTGAPSILKSSLCTMSIYRADNYEHKFQDLDASDIVAVPY